MAQKDLFDDTTMTFGEHLEVLRIHLWKAIIGLAIGSTAAFFFSNHIIVAIQKPVTTVMEEKFGHKVTNDLQDRVNTWEQIKAWFQRRFGEAPVETPSELVPPDLTLQIQLDVREIARKLHASLPDKYPELSVTPETPEAAETTEKNFVTISLAGTPLGDMLESMRTENLKPRTDSVDEAFMIYLKVSLVVGLVISSPWIFFQIWQFVAAGLYPHERKYVYSYLPLSLGLFLGGAFFCFYLVIPQVLGFLFEFNTWLGLRPEIKISTWISFALIVSLMFGLSFQLPMVMLILERMSLVTTSTYREKRRLAILIISILSMVLTPSDPVSMLMMLIPLCLLYELGIWICSWGQSRRSPFEAQPT
ncbi:MAG: twin-arginine translocase subunit TatC [Planctomycetales bacterium]